MTLFADGKQVGERQDRRHLPARLQPLRRRPVVRPGYADRRQRRLPGRGEYAFTGTIRRVIVDIGGDQKPMPKTPERD